VRDDWREPAGIPFDETPNSAIASEPGLADQTRERIAHWILHHGAVGQIAVVLLSHRGLNEYRLDEVMDRGRPSGSLRLSQHGTFNRLGRGSRVPRGTSLQLLIPTPELLRTAMSGRAWLNGRPAFARPLSEFERRLADRVKQIARAGQDSSDMTASSAYRLLPLRK
jgi:hypothetical protein